MENLNKKKVFVPVQKYVDYFENIRSELIELESAVEKIKNSKEFKEAYRYFCMNKTRGNIKEAPSKTNGYRIVFYEKDEIVRVDDLADIVTPEQMEQIKMLLNK